MAQKGLFAISRDRHGHRFWRRFTSYGFAAPLTDTPVVMDEITQTAAAMPVLFRREQIGITPIALLSLEPGQDTPFVSDQGLWRGTYVPSALRCPPFQAGAADQQGRMTLLVDETSGLVTDDPADEPFFDPDGTPTPAIAAVIRFLQARAGAAQRTATLCDMLDQMGLFAPLPRQDGIALPDGLLGIDPDRLAALSDPEIAPLMRTGGLRLIHAHQISLHHCLWLQQAGLMKDTPLNDKTSITDHTLDGFLLALAQAQEKNNVPGLPGEESTCLQATHLPSERGLWP